MNQAVVACLAATNICWSIWYHSNIVWEILKNFNLLLGRKFRWEIIKCPWPGVYLGPNGGGGGGSESATNLDPSFLYNFYVVIIPYLPHYFSLDLSKILIKMMGIRCKVAEPPFFWAAPAPEVWGPGVDYTGTAPAKLGQLRLQAIKGASGSATLIRRDPYLQSWLTNFVLWFSSDRAFEGLLNLVDLDLSENQLTFIPPGAFLTLVALRQPVQ